MGEKTDSNYKREQDIFEKQSILEKDSGNIGQKLLVLSIKEPGFTSMLNLKKIKQVNHKKQERSQVWFEQFETGVQKQKRYPRTEDSNQQQSFIQRQGSDNQPRKQNDKWCLVESPGKANIFHLSPLLLLSFSVYFQQTYLNFFLFY